MSGSYKDEETETKTESKSKIGSNSNKYKILWIYYRLLKPITGVLEEIENEEEYNEDQINERGKGNLFWFRCQDGIGNDTKYDIFPLSNEQYEQFSYEHGKKCETLGHSFYHQRITKTPVFTSAIYTHELDCDRQVIQDFYYEIERSQILNFF